MGIEKVKIVVAWKTDRWGVYLDFALVGLAISIPILSSILDHFFPDKSLFGRSGALIVLLGAILEVRQTKHQEAYNKAFQRTIIGDGIISPIYPERLKGVYSILRKVTHALVLAGTLIWGYGDLLF